MTRIGLILALVVATGGVLDTQQSPAFEVASVKPSEGGRSGALLDPQPSGYSAFNVPLSSLIGLAYQLSPYQIVGAPTGCTGIRTR